MSQQLQKMIADAQGKALEAVAAKLKNADSLSLTEELRLADEKQKTRLEAELKSIVQSQLEDVRKGWHAQLTNRSPASRRFRVNNFTDASKFCRCGQTGQRGKPWFSSFCLGTRLGQSERLRSDAASA